MIHCVNFLHFAIIISINKNKYSNTYERYKHSRFYIFVRFNKLDRFLISLHRIKWVRQGKLCCAVHWISNTRSPQTKISLMYSFLHHGTNKLVTAREKHDIRKKVSAQTMSTVMAYSHSWRRIQHRFVSLSGGLYSCTRRNIHTAHKMANVPIFGTGILVRLRACDWAITRYDIFFKLTKDIKTYVYFLA